MAAGEQRGTGLIGSSLIQQVAMTWASRSKVQHARKKIGGLPSSLELDRPPFTIQNREEQIVATREKSQWIVAQRLLSHLQYLDATKSSAKDLPPTAVTLWLVGNNLCR